MTGEEEERRGGEIEREGDEGREGGRDGVSEREREAYILGPL